MENIDLSEVSSFGCVITVDEVPHLCILDDGFLLDGIPLMNTGFMYESLDNNEIIIVGVSIKDGNGEEILDYEFINDENYDELIYVVTPLKIHTLKTEGMTIEDVIDLDFFGLLVSNVVDEYLEKLEI